MTNEDVINMLLTADFPKYYTIREVKQALNITISALEKESKTGHWIKYSFPRCGEQHYKCTSCGYYINFGQWGEFYTKEFKYCPNCGVRMAGAQSEDRNDED